MALLPTRPVRVQPFFGYRSATRLVLGARALRSPVPRFEPHSRLRDMRTILSQFTSREVAGLPVKLTVRGSGAGSGGVEHTAVTDKEGYARFDLALAPQWDLPAHPEWEFAMLSWISEDGPQAGAARILVPGRDSNLAVISDIDDTIIETGITGGLHNVVRNWRRLFAQLPHERIAVPDADRFYGELGGGTSALDPVGRPNLGIPATRRPFFYVSSSPWNLFNYLVAFQRSKGLPLGPLFLRDWGFNRRTLGSASHGAHKLAAIGSILGMYPDMRFALIGDDTQGDLPAFAEIVAAYPGRVAAVFLRIVSQQSFSPAELACQTAIEQAGVPLWLGDSFAVGREFLSTFGFTPGGETEQIVKAFEKDGGTGGGTEEKEAHTMRQQSGRQD